VAKITVLTAAQAADSATTDPKPPPRAACVAVMVISAAKNTAQLRRNVDANIIGLLRLGPRHSVQPRSALRHGACQGTPR
jgi:hypothetical protein